MRKLNFLTNSSLFILSSLISGSLIAEEIKKEETKPAEEIKKEETKPAEEIKKEETKPAEEIKKEDVKKENVKPAETTNFNPFEFHGYARMGYRFGTNPMSFINDSHGTGGSISKTRLIVSDYDYFRLSLINKFDNGGKLEFSMDNDSNTHPGIMHNKDWKEWSGFTPRLRDLYLELPANILTANDNIWFGVRRVENEDIRLLNFRPFDLIGYGGGNTLNQYFGFGINIANSTTTVSLQDLSDPIIIKPTFNDVLLKDGSDETVKSLVITERVVISLSDNMQIKPTFMVRYDKGLDKTVTIDKKEGKLKLNSDTNVKAGAVLSHWGEGYWANHFIWLSTANRATGVKTNAKNVNENIDTNKHTDKNLELGLASSGSYTFNSNYASIIYGIDLRVKNYKYDQQLYKIEDKKINDIDAKYYDKDGNNKTKSNVELSLDVQPVYYITDHVHVALDINVVEFVKHVDAGQHDALFVSPILRYAKNKNAVGTPQIYTSFTYAKYDVKSKNDANAKPVDSLLTGLAGFEVWF